MLRVMQVGNISVMVFQSDDTSRDSLNRSVTWLVENKFLSRFTVFCRLPVEQLPFRC